MKTYRVRYVRRTLVDCYIDVQANSEKEAHELAESREDDDALTECPETMSVMLDFDEIEERDDVITAEENNQ